MSSHTVPPSTTNTMCDTCLARARTAQLRNAWVYTNGHILDNTGRLPTLADFPAPNGPLTLCGLTIDGMGTSRLYRLKGTPQWTR